MLQNDSSLTNSESTQRPVSIIILVKCGPDSINCYVAHINIDCNRL